MEGSLHGLDLFTVLMVGEAFEHLCVISTGDVMLTVYVIAHPLVSFLSL